MAHKTRILSRASLAALAAASCMWGACTLQKATELVAGITTQMYVPKDLAAIGVVAVSGGQIRYCDSYLVQNGLVMLPSSFAMNPSGNSSEPVTFTVLGFRTDPGDFQTSCLTGGGAPNVGGNVRVLKMRRTPYVDTRIVSLPMQLSEACVGVVCPAEQTCIAGQCKEPDIDPNTLPEFDPSIVMGTDQSTCFPPSRCLTDVSAAPAVVIDDPTCLFEYPENDVHWPVVDPMGLNVKIMHRSFSSEILAVDPEEGFTIPDPTKPHQFQLAPGLCTLYHFPTSLENDDVTRDKLAAVNVSTMCPPRNQFQSICQAELQAMQTPPAGSTDANLCIDESGPLEQAQSFLYVLMDRTSPMSNIFGPNAIQKLFSFTLQDPSFVQTKVAFNLMPASKTTGDCAGSPPGIAYQSPAVTFGFPVDPSQNPDVRTQVANIIGDTTNVISDPSVQILLDSPMAATGAYAALRNEIAASTRVTNRAALLIVGYDFGGLKCDTNANLPALAQTQFNSTLATGKIYTYVAVAAPSSDTTACATSAEELADNIAQMGSWGSIETGYGYQAFSECFADTYPGGDPIATLFATLQGDLGACVYDMGQHDFGQTDADATLIKLSYANPATLGAAPQRVDVGFNSACNDSTADTATGWSVNRTTGEVRICGADCAALKTAISSNMLYQAQYLKLQPTSGIAVQVASAAACIPKK